jgi:hypothetical protein
MTVRPPPGREKRAEIASLLPLGGEPYEMSSKVDPRLRDECMFEGRLHFGVNHLSLISLTDEARFLRGRLPVNLEKYDMRSVNVPSFISSTAIPAMRSARIQECAAARPKDTLTDHGKKYLPHKRTTFAIFLGTTFLPVCHTHANANLTRLERWDRRFA